MNLEELPVLDMGSGYGPKFDAIAAAVCQKHPGVTVAEVFGQSRETRIIPTRLFVFYLCRKCCPGASMQMIAEHFHKEDHGSIIYACKKIEKGMAANADYRGKMAVWVKFFLEWKA